MRYIGTQMRTWNDILVRLPIMCLLQGVLAQPTSCLRLCGMQQQAQAHAFLPESTAVAGQVRQMYGVPKDLLGLLEGRQTYVIGKDGTVKLVYNNQFQARDTFPNCTQAASPCAPVQGLRAICAWSCVCSSRA